MPTGNFWGPLILEMGGRERKLWEALISSRKKIQRLAMCWRREPLVWTCAISSLCRIFLVNLVSWKWWAELVHFSKYSSLWLSAEWPGWGTRMPYLGQHHEDVEMPLRPSPLFRLESGLACSANFMFHTWKYLSSLLWSPPNYSLIKLAVFICPCWIPGWSRQIQGLTFIESVFIRALLASHLPGH